MRKKRRAVLLALAVSALLVLLAGLGVLERADLTLSDLLYQRRAAAGKEVVIIGIDQKALTEYGPYDQWGREIVARLLETLSSAGDSRPAAVGIDILYTGTTDPAADARLAQAAEDCGCVVTACLAGYGTVLTPDGQGDFGLDAGTVVTFEESYDALLAASASGHVNAMLDGDGILRHHMLSLSLPDGREVPSMALELVRQFRACRGEEPPALPITSSRGFWYLPYCGTPGDIEVISVADVLSGACPADYFDGKIAIIGPYAAGLQDSYLTSADHASPMYGVEYHANAVRALLEENYKREVRNSLQLAALFFLLLAAFAGFWRRPVKHAAVLWAVLSAGWVLLCRGLYAGGWILHVLWAPAGVTILYVGCIAFNYIQAALERQRVTNTFKRYVAPEIVSELLREDPAVLALGGKLTEIAVLFVDVRGFTPMSEILEPAQVVEILNRYLTLISDCILKNGGTLDKFVGDAAMAFWGAPLPQEDYIMRAVRTASDMVSGSRALSQELLAQYGRTVSFGIGIHTGEAVVGNIGSPQRMDYTAIGDTVNTAARLEANAPGGVIYISRAVADALEGRIRTTSLGDSVKLKGKKEGFEVLTMDGIL